MVKLLIVNADDFGLNENVCNGIEHCYKNGIVTSTSLMVNMPRAKMAADISEKNDSLGVGLHLNLTQGKSVNGNVQFKNSNLIKALFGRISREKAQDEIEAQIQAALNYGIKLTHIDGHKHIHVMPKIIDAVIDSALTFKIKKIRLPLESYSTTFSIRQSPKTKLLRYLSLKAKIKIEKAGLWHADHFYGISETGALDEEKLKNILKNLPDGVSEIMCHPGYPVTGDRLDRKKELMALTDRTVKRTIEEQGIKLVNYGDI